MTKSAICFGGFLAGTVLMLTGPRTAEVQWWGGGYYSSTIQEGAKCGFADVVRSAGIANLLDSEAAINYEQARSLDYDNRLKGTETYFTMRRLNKQYRDSERAPPATSEQLFRWAHRASPARLNSYEYDELTGQINWPLLLREPNYEAYRKAIEEFFKFRAEYPQKLQMSDVMRVQDAADTWLMVLKEDIQNYKPNDYLLCKFVESLSAEAGRS